MKRTSGALGIAVVGLGVGQHHLDALAALAALYEVRAVCDLDEGRLAATARRLGTKAMALRHLDDVLADPSVDIVALCTPPHLHLAQIRQVLAAGKHVVCEKPLVGSLDELAQLRLALAQGEAQVFPVFQSRFGEGLRQLKHLQACGFARHALVATIETHWRRGAEYYATAWRGRWATERGGVCLTQAIHAHDMLTHVLGPVHTVSAQLATRVNDIEVEDCLAAALRMADGSLASLSATLGATSNRSRLRFLFADLSVESASANPYRPAQGPWRFEAATPAIEAQLHEALAALPPAREGFERLFELIHASLRDGSPPPVTLDEAEAALSLVTAIYASAAADGAPIALPLPATDPARTDWRPAGGGFARSLA